MAYAIHPWSLTSVSLLSHTGLLAVPFAWCIILQLFPWLTTHALRFNSNVTSERSSLTLCVFHIKNFLKLFWLLLLSYLSSLTKLRALEGSYPQHLAHDLVYKWTLTSLWNKLLYMPALCSLTCTNLHWGSTHHPAFRLKVLAWHSRHSTAWSQPCSLDLGYPYFSLLAPHCSFL